MVVVVVPMCMLHFLRLEVSIFYTCLYLGISTGHQSFFVSTFLYYRMVWTTVFVGNVGIEVRDFSWWCTDGLNLFGYTFAISSSIYIALVRLSAICNFLRIPFLQLVLCSCISLLGGKYKINLLPSLTRWIRML